MQKAGFRTHFIVAAIAFTAFPALGVMPPYYEAKAALERASEYQTLRSEAPYAMEIEVTKAQVNRTTGDQCPSREDWDIEARVLSSIRGTATPGNIVRIQYTRNMYRCPGPIREEIPALAVGQRTEAYLNCQSYQLCVPAARAASFTSDSTWRTQVIERREDFERETARMRGPNPPPEALQNDNAVFFRRASLELQPTDIGVLQLHVQYLKEEPRVRIRLLSYAEPSMSREAAFVISEKRALVVQRFLVNNGVSSSRIEIRPLGLERKPAPPTVKITGSNTSLQGVVVIDYGL